MSIASLFVTITSLLLLHPVFALALNLSFTSSIDDRRSFLQKASVVTIASFSPSGGAVFVPKLANAAAPVQITQMIKVTPIAHTFVSSVTPDKASIKPLRENDATRYLTNARVVHVFYDGTDDKAQNSFREVLELTVNRKKNEGAGVTPGTVHLLCSDDAYGLYKDVEGLSIIKNSASNQSPKAIIDKLPPGDVVMIGLNKSSGTIGNGKIVEETGSKCRLNVGGQRGGGVISMLLNGPRDSEPVVVVDGAYSTSTILWYDV